ncbi:MAG TPA: hypothetical protein V6C88_07755 [Chroococcidiopsis sp.]
MPRCCAPDPSTHQTVVFGATVCTARSERTAAPDLSDLGLRILRLSCAWAIA